MHTPVLGNGVASARPTAVPALNVLSSHVRMTEASVEIFNWHLSAEFRGNSRPRRYRGEIWSKLIRELKFDFSEEVEFWFDPTILLLRLLLYNSIILPAASFDENSPHLAPELFFSATFSYCEEYLACSRNRANKSAWKLRNHGGNLV